MSVLGALTAFRRGGREGLAFLLLVLLPILSIAGGLGIAPAMAILGIGTAVLGLSKSVTGGEREPLPGWFWGVMAFAFWAAISCLWSNYPVPEGWGVVGANPIKLILGVVLYTVAALGLLQSARLKSGRFQMVSVISICALIILLFLDLATQYRLTFLVDPISNGEDPLRKLGDAEMNVGHGITVAGLVLAPTLLGLWELSKGQGRAVQIASAVILCGLLFGASLMSGLWVGAMIVVLSLIVMGVAWFAPRATTIGVFGLGVLSLITAPLVGRFSAGLDATAKAGLPFSWEHRVESWAYVTERIFERPLIGHGFDAVRTMDATKTIRDYEMSLISLHPHSAGLHIWAETGIVGVGLAVLALILLARATLGYVFDDRVRAMAVSGTVAAATLISSVSYGVWQEWWWATLFLAAALIPVMLRDA